MVVNALCVEGVSRVITSSLTAEEICGTRVLKGCDYVFLGSIQTKSRTENNKNQSLL